MGSPLVVCPYLEAPEPTAEERELAGSDSDPATLEQRLARVKVVRHFYASKGFSEARFHQDLKGINLDKPVRVQPIPPPKKIEQWVHPSGSIGVFFDPIGGQTPDSLGIYEGEGESKRQHRSFAAPPGEALVSTAAPIVDYWTMEGKKSVDCKGGGVQAIVDPALLPQLQEQMRAGAG